MEIQIIISVLLSIIGFLLGSLFFDMKDVKKNVQQMLIDNAASKERIGDLEGRIERLEKIKRV